MIEGIPREIVLDPKGSILAPLLADNNMPFAILEVTSGSYANRQPPVIRGTGHVIRSLEAALWAFHIAPDFSAAILRAVNLGDDSDTTGAIAGQMAGAYFGESGIPQEWLDGLARKDMLEKVLAPILG